MWAGPGESWRHAYIMICEKEIEQITIKWIIQSKVNVDDVL